MEKSPGEKKEQRHSSDASMDLDDIRTMWEEGVAINLVYYDAVNSK